MLIFSWNSPTPPAAASAALDNEPKHSISKCWENISISIDIEVFGKNIDNIDQTAIFYIITVLNTFAVTPILYPGSVQWYFIFL
jgi:hypothetical protein